MKLFSRTLFLELVNLNKWKWNISVNLEQKTKLLNVGYNGAGKTTLLKNIAGIYKPENGEVLFDSEPIFDNETKKEEIFFMPDDLYFGAYATMKKMADFYNGYYKRFN